MDTTPSQDESREMLKWLNRNRWQLLDLYRNQYIAYNDHRLIAHMTIEGHTFIAPVAWLQTNTGGEQLLLGREVVLG